MNARADHRLALVLGCPAAYLLLPGESWFRRVGTRWELVVGRRPHKSGTYTAFHWVSPADLAFDTPDPDVARASARRLTQRTERFVLRFKVATTT